MTSRISSFYQTLTALPSLVLSRKSGFDDDFEIMPLPQTCEHF